MEFTVLRARLEFEALEDISLPAGSEINTFRGALGLALQSIVCKPDCREASTCAARHSCVYARFFEPVWKEGPSGYHDAPRPFVLRASGVGGGAKKGELLRSDLFVFDRDHPPWPELEKAFERAAAQGLGPSRGRARLKTFAFGDSETAALRMPLQEEDEDPGRRGRLRLLFATPTELKSGGDVCAEPDFGVLTHRILERLWALGCLYQGWQTGNWDYRELLDLGRGVRLLDWSWRHTGAERRSSRTGQRHSIGGFTGWAEYEGAVGPFLPVLKIARWIGVGRQTVWGKGEVRVKNLEWEDD
jgi:CRISPR-associated endoribonuclease Cas6